MRRSCLRWRSGTGQVKWVFRGHRCADWRLIPCSRRDAAEGADRELMDLANFRSYVSPIYEERQREAELHMLYCFTKLADELGLKVPDPFDEIATFGEARDKLGTQELRELAAVAQHHGVPTTMLDWTDDPTIACYFACSGAVSRFGETQDLCVWAFDVERGKNLLEKHAVGKCALYFPNDSGSDYMRVQRGVFTDIFDGIDRSGGSQRWQCLASILREIDEQATSPVLLKFVLGANHGAELERLLVLERVTEAYLKPSLDSVATQARRAWRHPIRMMRWGSELSWGIR